MKKTDYKYVHRELMLVVESDKHLDWRNPKQRWT